MGRWRSTAAVRRTAVPTAMSASDCRARPHARLQQCPGALTLTHLQRAHDNRFSTAWTSGLIRAKVAGRELRCKNLCSGTAVELPNWPMQDTAIEVASRDFEDPGNIGPGKHWSRETLDRETLV